MRWAAISFLFFLACEAEPPPPGEVIGTFAFMATLEANEDCILEDVEGVPGRISFRGILSHDHDSDKVWLRSGNFEGEGVRDGNRFSIRIPLAPPGIPRAYAACTSSGKQPCPLAFTEVIEGEILADCTAEGAVAALEDGTALSCPEEQEDGTVRWHDCACVRGTFREEVTFEVPDAGSCTCEGRTRTEFLREDCQLVYRLVGEKV